MRSARLPIKQPKRDASKPDLSSGPLQTAVSTKVVTTVAPDSDEHEWSNLVQRIKTSHRFKRAKSKRQLLDFLYANGDRLLKDGDIEEEFFKQDRSKAETFEPARTRVAVGALKQKLEKYKTENKGEKWYCEVPDAKEAGGYQLKFLLNEKHLTPSQSFWKVHLDTAEDAVVISGSHLFFFDQKESKILRYYDFNLKKDAETAEILEDLKRAHKECDTSSLTPWHDTYLATGDVHAHSALQRWFFGEKGILIPRITSRQITQAEVHRRTPILIGRPQTNPFIDRIMNSAQAAALGYRIHNRKGTVKISNIKQDERERLAEFAISSDGVVGPITEAGKVFGIVTRMPNPSGRGHVTIIACDYYAMVIARIAEALTDDKQAQELLDRMKWPANKPLPGLFEMLFTVTLSPGNLEGEGYPHLIAWRPAEI